MPWVVHLPSGKHVNVEDLPLADWSEISKLGEDTWWKVMGSPLLYPASASLLVTICVKHAGDEPLPDGWLTGKRIAGVFEFLDEDELPSIYIDGVPDPKASGDGPETTTSSSSSTGSAGRRTSRGVKPSAI